MWQGKRKSQAVSEHARSGLGAGSAPGPLARQRRGFARFELRGRRRNFGEISWQAQHFRKVNFSQGLNCVAGPALSIGQVQISWQVQHFRKVKYRFRGRRSTFARSSKDFVAGAAFSPGQVQNSRQVQHFRKVMCRTHGRRSILARSGADFVAGAALARSSAEFVAGAALSQGQVIS